MTLEAVSGENLCGVDPRDVIFAAGQSLIAEGTLTRPGGSRIAVSITYSPLYDEEGRLANIIANVVDITRFREAEEMKSTFVSVVSHELKTPVALIKGYANTLAREDATWDAETLREGLQVIGEESDRLNGLINNLLDASRIQAGGFKLEQATWHCPSWPPAWSRASAPRPTGTCLCWTSRPIFLCVSGDEERLRQVFNNLVSNAIKYAPQGGEIRLGGWADGVTVTAYVADQGIGIPQAEQGKLFQRFYRVDSSLRRSTQGAGLGLFLCRAIIEAHGGRIWLRSEPGKGTTVFFTLPIGEE